MKVFRAFRLGLWVILLAACVMALLSYEVIAKTVLDKTEIQNWLENTNGYVLLRDEFITPQLVSKVAAAQQTPSALLGDDVIRAATNATLTPQLLQRKSEPVIAVISSWLDSKRPDVTFSLDTSDIHSTFFANLESAIVKKATSLPPCTTTNTIEDVDQGICRSNSLSPQALGHALAIQTQSQATDIFPGTLTQDDFSFPVQPAAIRNLPDYINYLWTLAIIAAGFFGIGVVALLFIRRLFGLVAIGVSGFVGGGLITLAGVIVSSRHLSYGADPFSKALSAEALNSMAHQAISLGLVTAAVGAGISSLALGGWFMWRKRRK